MGFIYITDPLCVPVCRLKWNVWQYHYYPYSGNLTYYLFVSSDAYAIFRRVMAMHLGVTLSHCFSLPLLPTRRLLGCPFPTTLTPVTPPWPLQFAAAVSCRVGVLQPHSCFGLDSFQWLSAWPRFSYSTLATGALSHHWGTIHSLHATFRWEYQSWLLGPQEV